MNDIGHNSVAVVGGDIKAFVERIERVSAEIDDLKGDVRDIYAEAKSSGLDVKILRKIIARRKLEKAKRDEEDALLGLYEDALSRAFP